MYSCLCELADLWCEDNAKLTYEASKETYIPPNSFSFGFDSIPNIKLKAKADCSN